MTVNYRESYGMYACNGILFNHESPRLRLKPSLPAKSPAQSPTSPRGWSRVRTSADGLPA
ncbi:GDP-mannose 4,6-dehydratase [Escherichia coli]